MKHFHKNYEGVNADVVVRDFASSFIAAQAWNLSFCFVEEVETETAFSALVLAHAIGARCIVLEEDFMLIINCLQQNPNTWQLRLKATLLHYYLFLSYFDNVLFSLVNRTQNNVTHILAQQGKNSHVATFLGHASRCLHEALLTDIQFVSFSLI